MDPVEQKALSSDSAHRHDVTSFATDPELEGLTLYEKKCILINREIDSHGMGRYQWFIWSLCGFGYLLDLMWAQAFGLVLSPLEQELGFPGRSLILQCMRNTFADSNTR